MNTIIITGNGFDLAHGLKTSYKDLMEFLKNNADLDNKAIGKCGTKHYDKKGFISFEFSNDGISTYNFTSCKDSKSIYFKNLFTEFNNFSKWVDLESLYYELIKKHQTDFNKVLIINEEFDYLKSLLEKYLDEEVEIKLPDYNSDFRETFFNTSKLHDSLLGVINFNYTNKVINYHLNYLRGINQFAFHSNYSTINIHGKLKSTENPIVFGYGDDNSTDYKSIQNVGKKELLQNFKTFQYLRNNNYHKVLAMLESEKNIRIVIIGHSCGLTDKTLLKTIFQHENVKKIEYRYHQNEDKYFENLYSISRIFDNNEMMREKLVSLEETLIIPKLSFE